MTTTESRDEELGASLRALPTPEHHPDFERELRRRLAGDSGARRWRTPAALVAVAAAALGILAIGLPQTSETPRIGGPEPASAATVRRAVRHAYESLRNLSGRLTADGKQWRFTLDSAGDFRIAGPTEGEVIAYDAQAGEVRSSQRSASLGGGPLFYAVRSGVAPGAPDQGPPTWLLPEQFGPFVRAALAAHDPRVTETRFDGRPAWRMESDRFTVFVDRETGLPVSVVERAGAQVHELRIDDLTVNGDVRQDAFRLDFPAGAEVMRSDDGFRRVDLSGVRAVVGYRPLVPATVPDGYELQTVAVAREAASTANGSNPASRLVVSLRYARGLDQFVVTTRARSTGEAWSDPVATTPGRTIAPDDVAVGSGRTAHVVLAAGETPHLWLLDDSLVITVAGDLDRAELLAVARSL